MLKLYDHFIWRVCLINGTVSTYEVICHQMRWLDEIIWTDAGTVVAYFKLGLQFQQELWESRIVG
jgi:hypothetical protein